MMVRPLGELGRAPRGILTAALSRPRRGAGGRGGLRAWSEDLGLPHLRPQPLPGLALAGRLPRGGGRPRGLAPRGGGGPRRRARPGGLPRRRALGDRVWARRGPRPCAPRRRGGLLRARRDGARAPAILLAAPGAREGA